MRLISSPLLSLVIGVLMLTGTRSAIEAQRHGLPKEAEEAREVLYFPSLSSVRLSSFGYRNALADTLWFATISYFGKHYRSDRSYRWLGHMCELVVSLQPRAPEPVEFCTLMLSWEAGLPEVSIRVLTRGIEADPDNWKFYYLRGFNYMFFLKDSARATEDFVKAASLPNAHVVVVRLASKKLAELKGNELAEAFLKERLSSARDEFTRGALESRLKQIESQRERKGEVR